ncbi:MAG: shikimate dehydrogenase [Betaproteobacteria bacterium]
MNPDRYFVLGNPVAHSHSPFIHAMFAAQTGQHLQYDRRLCPLDGFAEAVRALAADTEGGRVRGCNVTVPFKHEALRLAASASDRARQAGAANVLSFDDGHWQADNTDGAGLMRDLQVHAACTVRGQQVLLVGAGGAAAGVLGPLLASGPARVVVANRTVARAQALVEAHARLAAAHGATLEATGLDLPGQAFDVVLNASASSLSGAAVPVPDRVLRLGTLAVDLMYGPAATAFLSWAQRHGAVARDGLGMLVEQAAEAFWIWRGVRPDTVPVLHALRERVGAAP